VLVYDGAVSEAVRVVGAAAGHPAWELAPMELDAALTALGVEVGGARDTRRCDGGPLGAAELRQQIDSAERLVGYLELREARAALDQAAFRLPCLREPAEASALSRLFLLQGVVAASEGDPAAALAAFVRAQASQPGLPYDKRLPAAAAPLWTEAAAAPAHAELVVIGPSDRLWVDGRPAPSAKIALTAGRHLLQRVGGAGLALEVEVEPGAPVLVAVAGVSMGAWVEALGQPGGPALWTAVAPTAPAFVVYEGKVWRGPGDWVALPVPAAAGEAAPLRPGAKRGRALLGGGVATLSIGLAGVIGGYAWGATHREATDAADLADARRAHDVAQGYTWVSLGLVGAGAGLGAAGLVVGGRP
jgi:hypothetical protein